LSVGSKNGPHLIALPRQPLAQLDVEIAKRKTVWEESPSALECEMTTKNNQAALEQSAKIL
jgi:hypothetical protein